MHDISEKSIKCSRIMYIFEAGFEYLISILVSGSFLATLTSNLGMSDSLTGIISSFISLGCLFQLFSVFYRKKSVKKAVIILSVINQLLFLLLYIIPLSNGNKNFKTIIFIVAIFTAYIIYNFAHPKKINWFMSLVDDHKRGRFTANKEIISLISGIFFQFIMGAVVDYYAEIGKIRTAYIIAAVVMFLISILHTLTMIFTVEKDIDMPEKKNLVKTIGEIAKDKNILKVTIVFVLYYASTYVSVPFHGIYNINELGFSLKFVSIITICGSISRILLSKFWGKYADRKSFAKMIEKCFIILGIGYFSYFFASPNIGAVAVIIYTLLHGVAMGGINSALINLIFDYVPIDKRADSLAISQAFSGVVGFLATIVVSPVVTYIQKNGNTFLGVPLYAQQLLSLLSLIITLIAIFYVRIVLTKKNLVKIISTLSIK